MRHQNKPAVQRDTTMATVAKQLNLAQSRMLIRQQYFSVKHHSMNIMQQRENQRKQAGRHLTSFRVPDTHGVVATSGQNLAAVVGYGDGIHVFSVPLEHLEHLHPKIINDERFNSSTQRINNQTQLVP